MKRRRKFDASWPSFRAAVTFIYLGIKGPKSQTSHHVTPSHHAHRRFQHQRRAESLGTSTSTLHQNTVTCQRRWGINPPQCPTNRTVAALRGSQLLREIQFVSTPVLLCPVVPGSLQPQALSSGSGRITVADTSTDGLLPRNQGVSHHTHSRRLAQERRRRQKKKGKQASLELDRAEGPGRPLQVEAVVDMEPDAALAAGVEPLGLAPVVAGSRVVKDGRTHWP